MISEAVDTKVREHLAQLNAEHQQNAIQAHRQQIQGTETRITDLGQRLARNLMEARTSKEQLDLLFAAQENNTYADHLVTEWDALKTHPRLAKAALTNDALILTTTDDLRLHCEGREDTRWLGAFKITIYIANGSLEINNLNTRRGGRDHPHVSNGQPCFGGDANAFAQLQADGDLFVLFEMLLQYLETLNLRDEWGRFGAYWFEAEDARPEGTVIEAAPAETFRPEDVGSYAVTEADQAEFRKGWTGGPVFTAVGIDSQHSVYTGDTMVITEDELVELEGLRPGNSSRQAILTAALAEIRERGPIESATAIAVAA